MTNEQLAILISGYAHRLTRIVEKLDSEMPEGTERHLEWRRKDGNPGQPFWNAKDDPDFEQVATGDCICLDGLR